ncbi:MFS transporter, partial [Senegalimassilia anaerobia]
MTRFVDSKLTLREWLPLIGITVSAFIFNTSEFMPVGLLTGIGASFGTSEGVTGLIISVYAWAVMLLSLPLMILGSRLAFRPLMLLVIGVFCAGQALSALAPSYGLLMAARLVVACAHSVFWAIAAPVAVKVVDERHAPMAVSAVVTGSALAMVVGLPLGRMVGLWLGWRQTFGCVCAVSALVLAYLAVVFPKIPASKPFTLKQLPSILRNKVLMGIFIV